MSAISIEQYATERRNSIRRARELRDAIYFTALKHASWEGKQILLSAAEHSDCLDLGIKDTEFRYTTQVVDEESFGESGIDEAIRHARQHCFRRPL